MTAADSLAESLHNDPAKFTWVQNKNINNIYQSRAILWLIKMSIFNEKDQYFKDCFSEQFADSDSDDDLASKDTNRSANSEGDITLDTQAKADESLESSTKSIYSKNEEVKQGTPPAKQKSKIEPEFITISSDDDTIDADDDDNIEIQEILMSSHKSRQSITEQPSSSSLNVSILGDEPMELKVMIAGDYKRFPTTYGAPLYDAFRSYIQELREHSKTLIISLHGRQLPLDQSAMDLEINQATILHGIEVSKNMMKDVGGVARGNETKEELANEDPNLITVKLQDGHRRNTKEIRIGKTDQLIELKKKYAELLNIKDLASFKLKFDGDPVDESETPEDLDLEGDEAFDVIFS